MKKTFLISLLTFACAVSLSAQDTFSHKVGSNEVIRLSEGQGLADNSLLIDATQEIIDAYTTDGKFPIATSAFLVKRHGKNIVIDTGYGEKIFDNLESVGVKPEQVDEVLLTHMHGDHIGGLLKDGEKAFPNAKLVIGKIEHDYWTGTGSDILHKMPENKKGNFLLAQQVIEKYGDNLELVDAMEIEDVPAKCGLYPVAAYGHTPGHIGYMVSCGKNRMLVWGDLTHAMAVQIPHPEISVTYDIDPQAAAESRMKILNYVAENEIPIAGMHIPYTGMGSITRQGVRGYVFTPFE